MNAAGPVYIRWAQLKDWSEQKRYEHGQAEAIVRQFYEAITDSIEGVLQWLKARW